MLSLIAFKNNKYDERIYSRQDELKEQFSVVLTGEKASPYPMVSKKTIVLGELSNPKEAQKVLILTVQGGDKEGRVAASEIDHIISFRNAAYKAGHDPKVSFCTSSLMDIYLHHIENNQKLMNKGVTSQLIEDFREMLADALEKGASDIHIEVRPKITQVRYRIDSQLMTVKDMSSQTAERLVTAIYSVEAQEQDVTFKKDESQDAVIDKAINGQHLRVRLSTMPASPDGFDCIMRLLPVDKTRTLELHELGYSDEQIELINAGLDKPVGAIVLAGTTGSGKSTTLKNMLEGKIKKAQGSIKVITVEDPPEYVIDGATQVPVSKNKKTSDGTSSSAAAIRAVMRSDPDILMVGEVRDDTSAKLFVDTVQSGHQGYTTVHASSAIGIVNRLLSLKVEKDALGSPEFIGCLIYQALLPKLCLHCRKPLDLNELNHALDKGLIKRIKAVATPDSQLFMRGDGCDKCNLGIKGKTVAAEVILPDADMLRFFKEGKTIDALEQWLNNGGKRIIDHGIAKMCGGIVSPVDVEDILGRLTDNLFASKNNTNGKNTVINNYAIITSITNYIRKAMNNSELPPFNPGQDEQDEMDDLSKTTIFAVMDAADEVITPTDAGEPEVFDSTNPFGMFEFEEEG